jgi:hypothetical protein
MHRGAQGPVFPGETIHGHVEFKASRDVAIDKAVLFVTQNIHFTEQKQSAGLVQDTVTTYSFGEELFFDRFEVPLAPCALKKGEAASWPFSFKLNAAARPGVVASYSATDVSMGVAVLFTIWTADKKGEPEGETDLSKLSSLSSGAAGADLDLAFRERPFRVGGAPFSDPVVVVRQQIDTQESRGAVGAWVSGSSKRDANAGLGWAVKRVDYAAPFERRVDGVDFTSAICCGSAGTADVVVRMASRVIYVPPSSFRGKFAPPLRGSWGRLPGTGEPVKVRIDAALAIANRGGAKLTKANVAVHLEGVLWKKCAPSRLNELAATAREDEEPSMWFDCNKEVVKFPLPADPRDDGELAPVPIDPGAAVLCEESDRFSPSFVTTDLAMQYYLVVRTKSLDDLIRVPVVRNAPPPLPSFPFSPLPPPPTRSQFASRKNPPPTPPSTSLLFVFCSG